jgi:acylglycerol lipase
MKHFETSWQTKDGLKLYSQGWEPETTPQAIILLVHGLGEHSSRYEHVAAFFSAASFATLTYDLRGHGKSEGQRGHTPSFEAFMADIDLLFSEADRRYGSQARFLYGHSLGGILVLNYTLKRKPRVAGVIATSSGLRTAIQDQKLKMAFAKAAASILPTMSMPTGLDANTISRDPAVVQAYKDDPLVHGLASLSAAKSLTESIDWAFQHASEFQAPLLLVHGTVDKLAYPRGSQEFASLVKGDCTLKLWEGLAHETHNEPEKEQVLAYTLEWMRSKM